MRRSELVRALERVPAFDRPDAALEQVITPSEAAATLLEAADRFDGLSGRSVLDLGCGTGRLAIGAALLGAGPVRGIDLDPGAVERARVAATNAGVAVEFDATDIESVNGRVEIVLMNPPFGAQSKHADRPFWERAFALAERSVYAFALEDSRTFIARRAVERGAQVLDVGPVPWALPRTFPHHVRRRVPLAVDLWALRTEPDP
ncbi:MAG: 50S ribosomal protein L11 methyltransferase [Thermoplasmata archaeon]